MLFAPRSFRSLLSRLVRRARAWLPGATVAIEPIDQLALLDQQAGTWLASGDDPKFACLIGNPPLRAGWYRFSMDLENIEGKHLEPRLYFDYGSGMQEEWSLPLNFFRATRKHHVGVVLLAADVHALRLDPASTPCIFRAGRLKIDSISRLGAAWRMMVGVLSCREALTRGRRALVREAWRKLFGPGGRHTFATWLHGQYVHSGARAATYERWVRLYERTDSAVPRPETLLSILLATYNTPEIWLRRCLDSVLAQTHANWELCIADDASTRGHVREVLEAYAARDPRIRVTWRERNGHISAASNTALAMARGSHVLLLDHDDELHVDALAIVAEALALHPQWSLAYSDEDKIDVEGQRYDPYFKPDWNPDLLLGQNCISHLGIYSRSLVLAVGGFREGFEGSQDWDLALRCSERLAPEQIGHIPRVLYHWRAIAGSTAQGVDQKSYAHEAGRRALQEHFERTGEAAKVVEIDGLRGVFRVCRPLPATLPRVAIIIPTRNQLDLLRRCVSSILERTSYPDYEVIIVDNQSTEPAVHAYLASFAGHPSVRVRKHDKPFNYSEINNQSVADCRSELICLLNNDTEVITPDWLQELASHALRPHVGAVGAMLYYPNDTIQHAGVVTGVHGVAAHPYCGMPRGHGGQMARARLTQAMSAVTAACMVVRREIYEQVGGLDPQLQVAFNDIDFCLRLRQHGYTNIWTPFAELYHHESATRGFDTTPEKRQRFAQEVAFMRRRWGVELEHDPAYNPNLTLSGEPFTLAFPPRKWRLHAAASAGATDPHVSPSRASPAH